MEVCVATMTARPLWTCPECGRVFAMRNQEHSCERWPLEMHFARKPAIIRELFDAVVEVLLAQGPMDIVVGKTSIGFCTRMRFAGAATMRRSLRVGFVLPYTVESPRVLRVGPYSTHRVMHNVDVRALDELDDELRAWLIESYETSLIESFTRGTR